MTTSIQALRSASVPVALALLLGGCSAAMISDRVEYQEAGESSEVPRAYHPAPGQCRVWFRDRPAAAQPPPGNCAQLRQDVPPGAVLIYG